MKIYICEYCKREFTESQKYCGHKPWCDKKPQYLKDKMKKNLIKSVTGRKHSKESKEKISKSRKEYLNKNPDKVPYLLNHSSKKSWPEKRFEKVLIENNVEGWIYNYQVLRFSLDFAFPEYMLDVEIDGHTHTLEDVIKKDEERTKILKDLGWNIIRFTAKEVKDDPFKCVQKVIDYLKLNINIKVPFDFINYKLNKKNIVKKDNVKKKRKQKKIKLNKIKISKYGTKKDFGLEQRRRNDEKYKPYIELIKNSNIDFSKFGWVKEVYKIIKINNPTKWMRRYMYDFWLENCFKRKGTKMVA